MRYETKIETDRKSRTRWLTAAGLALVGAMVWAGGAEAKPMHCTVTMKDKVVADEPCDVTGKRQPNGGQLMILKSGTKVEFDMRADETASVKFGEVSDIMAWKRGCWRGDLVVVWLVPPVIGSPGVVDWAMTKWDGKSPSDFPQRWRWRNGDDDPRARRIRRVGSVTVP